ncbi:MAG: glycosyltransferase family 9 protein [Deltaproteobacteria bacterium]|nr:glycosyltransferase family 9 protein [Deltaproteobacteria bacterium]
MSQFTNSTALILLGAFGDCVRMCQCLRSFELDSRVVWFIARKWFPLRELVPEVSFVPVTFYSFFFSVIKCFRKFDLVIDAQRLFKSGVLSLCLSRIRLGFHPLDCKEGNHFFNNCYIGKWQTNESKLRKYEQFFELAGFRKKKIVEHKTSFNEKKVALSLGGSWDSKKFVFEDIKFLLNLFLQHGASEFFILGGQDTKLLAKSAFRYLQQTSVPVNNLVGQSLEDTISFVRNFDGLGVGGDTGVAHLFSFFSKPYITLFGPSDYRKHTPSDLDNLRVKSGLYCSPCEKRKCYFGTNLCIRVAVKNINEVVKNLYSKTP